MTANLQHNSVVRNWSPACPDSKFTFISLNVFSDTQLRCLWKKHTLNSNSKITEYTIEKEIYHLQLPMQGDILQSSFLI
jgi:hypothetical protein